MVFGCTWSSKRFQSVPRERHHHGSDVLSRPNLSYSAVLVPGLHDNRNGSQRKTGEYLVCSHQLMSSSGLHKSLLVL